MTGVQTCALPISPQFVSSFSPSIPANVFNPPTSLGPPLSERHGTLSVYPCAVQRGGKSATGGRCHRVADPAFPFASGGRFGEWDKRWPGFSPSVRRQIRCRDEPDAFCIVDPIDRSPWWLTPSEAEPVMMVAIDEATVARASGPISGRMFAAALCPSRRQRHGTVHHVGIIPGRCAGI